MPVDVAVNDIEKMMRYMVKNCSVVLPRLIIQ
jgi:hypothetical protein